MFTLINPHNSTLCPLLKFSPLNVRPKLIRNKTTKTLCQSSAIAQVEKGIQNGVEQLQSSQSSQGPAFKASIDFKFIRDNIEIVKQNCINRKAAADPQKVADLYEEFLKVQSDAEILRTARNENAKAMKGKMSQEDRQALIDKGSALKEQVSIIEEQLSSLESQLQVEGQKIPNLTHPQVPIATEEEGASMIQEVGHKRQFAFEIQNHVDIAERLDLVDFDRAGEVSGSKFYYLKNSAALLEMALCNYAMQKCVAKGFTPVMTPDVVRASVLEKCGFQPRASNTQVYSIEDSELCLTGTAEVPLGGLYMDQLIDEKQLPIKLAAFGHCFRTEAGAAGAAGKGLYRVHQFSKVEMFVISTPEESEQILQELLELETDIYESLGLHFQILDMPSGDLGAPAYRKFDIEAWMPGLDRYGEISSASNCTDYQTRRLNIRYREQIKDGEDDKKKKKKAPIKFAHTLNATACAVPRLLVSIIENYQQEDGSVSVPEVLKPYMAGLNNIQPQK
eukprot:TRINITY_DN7732_c0_g1_i5.p1 TRINITY_DN7732_c0_g1~~TRINITY_DN7732_c0_g1_i5.p1  ORF type:complete len:537 (-),score=82.05 TRINITY_DN7732_c0_g1_i5:194-1711(-)